jgi:UDP-galactopyranose mutase
MWTFSKLWNIQTPKQAKDIILKQCNFIDEPTNLEEQAIKLVGLDVYEKFIRDYTIKQWKKNPKDLPKEIINRIPIRFTYNSNYFNDKYQGIPIDGYTQIFNKLLKDIDVKLNINFFENINYWKSISKNIIYTGPIDKYYDYCFGKLEYRSTNFIHKYINIDNYQGAPIINYTDIETKYTRIIEHKHFENNICKGTWITHEYPIEYIPDKTEEYYPINDIINNTKYLKYKKLSNNDKYVYFGGRLAEYKYYDMDKTIESALNLIKKIKDSKEK